MNTAWSRERSIGPRPRTVGGHVMKRTLRNLAAASLLLLALCAETTASAQKTGGVLKISFFDSPASMSLHEEATGAALRPAMGIFNNLVMYDQHVAQNRPDTIVADLATAWSWNEEGTALTFSLRQGVKCMMANPSLPPTSNAPWTCCWARPATSSASTRANRGTAISSR